MTKLKHRQNTAAYQDIILHIPIKNIEHNKTSTNDREYTPYVSVPSKCDTLNTVASCQWIEQTTSIVSNLYEDTKPMEQFAMFPFNSLTGNADQTNTPKKSHNKICSIEKYNKNIEQKQCHKNKCMWCTCEFVNKPYHLPLQYKNKEYIVYGNYCSAECAAAYNFYDIVAYGDMWDRYALLHSLYYKQYEGKKIELAPMRQALKMYGGTLSITEFRGYSSQQKEYIITFDPIKIHNTNHTVHLKQQSKDPVILKRTKPLHSSCCF